VAKSASGERWVAERIGFPWTDCPEAVRAEFLRRYEREAGFVTLPLEATYRLLAALGEPAKTYSLRGIPHGWRTGSPHVKRIPIVRCAI
jgi:hypothetical protein